MPAAPKPPAKKAAAKKAAAKKPPIKVSVARTPAKAPSKAAAKAPAKAPAKAASRTATKAPARNSTRPKAGAGKPPPTPTGAVEPRADELAQTVDEKAARAHVLHLKGTPWAEVAREAGYASEAGCRLAVTVMLQRAAIAETRELRAERLQVENDRLDALQKPYWDTATNGNLEHAEFVLKVHAARAKLNQLHEPDAAKTGSKTVVVFGDKEAFIGALKQIADSPAQGDIQDAEIVGD